MRGPRWSLVQYRAEGVAHSALGVQVADRVRLLPAPFDGLSAMDLLEDWDRLAPHLRDLDVEVLDAVSTPVTIVAPLTYPRKILCAGANYYSHAEEMGTSRPDPAAPPFFFLKPPTTTITGPDAAIAIDSGPDAKVDWEAELGVVISTRCKDLESGEATGYIAGYVVANDVSDRGAFPRPNAVFPPFGFDWLAHKGQDGFCPIGPGLVPTWHIPDPQDLRIELAVNGILKQDSTTRDMVVGVHELVAAASRMMTLEPGDLILTGTPAGVGMPRQDFLRPGDVVTVTVEGVGSLRNVMVAR